VHLVGSAGAKAEKTLTTEGGTGEIRRLLILKSYCAGLCFLSGRC
jgi:hypothetical protein